MEKKKKKTWNFFFCCSEKSEQQTLDLELSIGLERQLDSSKPLRAPLLAEVASLYENGVVGLARAGSAFFFVVESPCLGADLEWYWWIVQLRRRIAWTGFGRGGWAWKSLNRKSTTTMSSVMASLTHSSSLIFSLRHRFRERKRRRMKILLVVLYSVRLC